MSDTVQPVQATPLEPIASSPVPGTESLEDNVVSMQQHLAGILDNVDHIKRNCARLQSENRFIQEYIESLMIKRRSSESN